jgi:hypothetical protein
LFQVILGDFVHSLVVERLVGFSHHVRVQESVHKGLDEPLVFVVGDSSTLVDDRGQSSDHGVLEVFLVVDHHLKLILSHLQIGVREVLSRGGPADRAELLSVNKQRVEDRTTEEHGLEQSRVFTRIHPLISELGLGVEHHLLDIAGRLYGQLNTLLQYRNGEVRHGGSGQEQPEVPIGVGRLELLDHLLQIRHPRNVQVRVLEEQPLPAVRTALEETLGDGALALPQGDLFEVVARLLLREGAQVGHGVGAGCDDEDDGRLFGRGLVALLDAEERRVHEEGVHDFLDPLFDSRDDVVGPNCFVYQHFLEGVELLVPLSGERHFFRVLGVVDGLELLDIVYELLHESVELLEGVESVNGFVHLAPC